MRMPAHGLSSVGARAAVSRAAPPPIGGWNARDAYSAMRPEDAIVMENWFPRASDVVTRRGFATHCSFVATAEWCESLNNFKSGSLDLLIAGQNGVLWDASTTTETPLMSGFNADDWIGVNFNGSMILVNSNSSDPVVRIASTGSANSASFTCSGATSAGQLSNIIVYKSRLYFVEKDTPNFWYGGVNSVSGSLAKFPLSRVGRQGGNLYTMGVITVDGGDGPDDLICFFMTSGEVLIYSGSDPGDANNWFLRGVFNLGAPISRRVEKFGSDCVVINHDGYIPLTRVLPFGRADISNETRSFAFSDRIIDAVQDAIQTFAGSDGWSVTLYPRGAWLIFNVPSGSSTYVQHVMNIHTGRWAKFTGMNARCWCVYKDNLYFGGYGKVCRADYGTSDDGEAIVARCDQAFDYMGSKTRNKRFTMIRPTFALTLDMQLQLGIATDFATSYDLNYIDMDIVSSPAVWDEAIWDDGMWGGSMTQLSNWYGASGVGYAASLSVRASSSTQRVFWRSTDWMFELGGTL